MRMSWGNALGAPARRRVDRAARALTKEMEHKLAIRV
jgi:hypothetical protein